LNAHVKHRPLRSGDSNYLSFIGNGYFGLSDSDSAGQELYIAAAGQTRTLTVPVNFKPTVHIVNNEFDNYQSAKVVNYVKGLLHDVTCYEDNNGEDSDLYINLSFGLCTVCAFSISS
jgi:hypothetical protein